MGYVIVGALGGVLIQLVTSETMTRAWTLPLAQ